MSRKFAATQVACFTLVAAALCLSPTASFGVMHSSAYGTCTDDYRDSVLGGGTAEGDIWGGEQGTDPEIGPVGPSEADAVPLIFTLPVGVKPPTDPVPSAGQAGWLYQLGNFFDWLATSLRISNA